MVCFTQFKSCDHTLGSFGIVLLVALIAQLFACREIRYRNQKMLYEVIHCMTQMDLWRGGGVARSIYPCFEVSYKLHFPADI